MTPPPKPKRNKRLQKKSDHICGPLVERSSDLLDAPKLNKHGLAITDL